MAIKIIKPGEEARHDETVRVHQLRVHLRGRKGGLSSYTRHCYRLRCRNKMPNVRCEVLPLRNENKEVSNGN